MDKDAIITSIENAGWKKEEQKEYLGYKFNFVGTKSGFPKSGSWFVKISVFYVFLLSKWHILVRFRTKLSKGDGINLDTEFKDIVKKSKSFASPKHFCYCIVADSIDDAVTTEIESYNSSGFKVGGAMGAVFLVDMSKSKIYCEIPGMPLMFKYYSQDVNQILQQSISAAE